MKAKALGKKLDDILSELVKQMDLYGSFIFGLQMGWLLFIFLKLYKVHAWAE